MDYYPNTTGELINALSGDQGFSQRTIHLKPNAIYVVSGGYLPDGGFNAFPQITGLIDIRGNQAQIIRDSTAKFRFFEVFGLGGATLRLNSLTLQNGHFEATTEEQVHGGCIKAHTGGQLIIENCRFIDNQVSGGTDNSFGGAISCESLCTISGSFFGGNQASDAGALHGSTAIITIVDTIFQGNSLVNPNNIGGGGAIGVVDGRLRIEESSLIQNTANKGGALHCNGSALVEIYNSDIMNNTSTSDGGALYREIADYASPRVDVAQCRITGNTSPTFDIFNHGTTNISFTRNWWGNAEGPTRDGHPNLGDSISEHVLFAPFLNSEDCLHDAICECPFNYESNDCYSSGNPISLRLGEKRQVETDITLNTSSGALTFIRTYRQNAQNMFAFMGLGWTHNHNIYATVLSSTSIQVVLPEGGILRLTKSGAANRYVADAGSSSILRTFAQNGTCELTTSDGVMYHFELNTAANKYLVQSRVWPNGATWTYTYDSEDRLTSVADGYGNELFFTYYSSGSFENNLETVQARKDLTTLVTVGFTYSTAAGSVSGGVLSGVTDVRGKTWEYEYSSAVGTENYLLKRLSPEIASQGGTPITLEELTYETINGTKKITQKRGDSQLITEFEFSTDGNETRQTTANKQETHTFDRGTYAGTELPGGTASTGQREPSGSFRPRRQTDANGNYASMQWSVDGRRLENVTNPVGWSTGFNYQADNMLHASIDANSKQTLYFYDNVHPRQPSAVIATDGTNLAVNGDMEALDGWGSETYSNRRVPGAVSGEYARYIRTNAADSGIEQSGTFTINNGETYTFTAHVYRFEGKVIMQLYNGSVLWESEEATLTREWETLTYEYTHSGSSITPSCRLVTANSFGGSFVVDAVSILHNGVELVVNGNMEADSNWSSVNAPLANDRIGANTGLYSRRVDANSGEGIEGTNWQAIEGFTYTIFARIYRISGNVEMQVYNPAGGGSVVTSATTSVIDAPWQTLKLGFTHTGDDTPLRLCFLASGGAARFCVDTVYILDESIIKSWQEFTYDSNGKTLTEKTLSPKGAVVQGVEREYFTSGLLYKVTPIVEGGGTGSTWTSYEYDNTGRVTKTQNGGIFSTCCASYTVYDEAGNVVASISNYDPGTSAPPTTAEEAANLYNPSEPNKNHVTTYVFDELGRRIQTTTNAHAANERTTYTVYDALGRVRLTINNYDNPLISQDPDVYTYTLPYTWTWNETEQAWQDISDPVQTIAHTGNTNIISETVYNERGMVRLQRDVLGKVTLYGYDDPGRLIKTVQNASQRDYDNSYGEEGDPTLEDYPGIGNTLSPNADIDIISTQDYDPAGSLYRTISNPDFPAVRQVTLNGYDAANRVVRVVTSASQPDYDVQVDRNLLSYQENEASTAVDQDLITVTDYDSLGRVENAYDALGNVTRTAYDSLGRTICTVRNYVPQFNIPPEPFPGQLPIPPAPVLPETWRWNNLDKLWEYQTKSFPDPETWAPVDHDSDLASGKRNDQNIITTSVYGSSGRLEYTRDVLGTIIYYVYDSEGRTSRVIRNYVNPKVDGEDTYSPPASWYWDDAEAVWRSDPNTIIQHGEHNDQNIINDTSYSSEGQLSSTFNVYHQWTEYLYDDLRRQIKAVVNYVPQDEVDPRYWQWYEDNDQWAWRLDPNGSDFTPVNHGALYDETIITETVYDSLGRVQLRRDNRGNATYSVYDGQGRNVKTITNFIEQSEPPDNWVWREVSGIGAWRLSDIDNTEVDHGEKNDANLITATEEYDIYGRVLRTRDAAGAVTYNVYDALGRRVRTISNYATQAASPDQWVWRKVNNVEAWRLSDSNDTEVSHGLNPGDNDLNLISDTVYDKAGRVILTRDVRGTATAFTYDRAGRRLTTAQAAGTGLETKSYTCYDKSGRVLRTIQNWITNGTSPDAKDENGAWLFAPESHGVNNDRNLIAESIYDAAGRPITTIDPLGNQTKMVYELDGQVSSSILVGVAVRQTLQDVVTTYRYDGLQRRRVVVQNYIDEGYADPSQWYWDANAGVWKDDGDPEETIIQHDGVHEDNFDRNIIVQVEYDLLGRMTSLRNPKGMVTAYRYDQLGRRIIHVINYIYNELETDPINWVWNDDPGYWKQGVDDPNPVNRESADENIVTRTQYIDLIEPENVTGETQTIFWKTDGLPIITKFDRLGRRMELNYDHDPDTPTVLFEHDLLGNRTGMQEYDNTDTLIRETIFNYNQARRLSSVEFDANGDSNTDETVSYGYDLGGLRTRLTMPGDLDVLYTYNARGQLATLTDWDDQQTRFIFDNAGRHVVTERANGLRSRYDYDPAGRLRLLRHTAGASTFAYFAYEVDRLGNRTQALECLRHPGIGTTTIDHTDTAVFYKPGNDWSEENGFQETTAFWASLSLIFLGEENVELIMGEGPDHSIYDVYIGGSLWQSFDGYATTAGERTIAVDIRGDGPFVLEIRNRADRNPNSSGYKLRFKSLSSDALYDARTIAYQYDGISRILEANYLSGINTSADSIKAYAYTFDAAGNRLSETVDETRTDYEYNNANRLSYDGTNSYNFDDNGNLTSIVGSATINYAWDRANRLLSVNGTAYKYDGLGNRIQQTVDSIVTNYLLDMQPSLVYVLGATTSSDVERYVHSVRGIHAQQSPSEVWQYMITDGLGSIRGVVENMPGIIETTGYSPYGVPDVPLSETVWAFTGEMRDGVGVQYHRARYLNPQIGVFVSLDPFEGMADRVMSLNGYSWVAGNVINLVDPSGMISLYDFVSSESDYDIELSGDYGGRTLDPKTARDRFIELESYLRKLYGIDDDCPEEKNKKRVITYVDLLAMWLGGEFGVLGGVDYDIAGEVVGRWYYDYTQETGSSGQRQYPINPIEGFQGDELWILLGNVQSFWDFSIEELNIFRRDSLHRQKAIEILNGETNGQNVTTGLAVGGRPVRWGNPGATAPPQAFTRLQEANKNKYLQTHTDSYSTYYRNTSTYTYAVFMYYEPTQQVIWSYWQEDCLSRPSPPSWDGNPTTDLAPQPADHCRICDAPAVNCQNPR